MGNVRLSSMLALLVSFSCSGGQESGADAATVAESDATATGDAGSGPSTDGGPPLIDADVAAGAPSPDCVTPCLWELLSSCRASLDETCVSNQAGSVLDRCYSGGVKVRRTGNPGEVVVTTYYWPDGGICYSSTQDGVIVTYRDSANQVLITRMYGVPEEIVCNGQNFTMEPTAECIGGALSTPMCESGVCEIP